MRNILFKYQEPVFNSLVQTAETFFTQDWRNLPIRPRFSRFLVGPSGSGKTHIVQAVAEHMELPFYSVDATNWMPLGASDRSSRNSWADLITFLAKNDKGIIFVDELDKLGDFDTPGSSWLRFLRVEVFTLLDRRVPQHLSLPEEFEEEDRAITFHRIRQRLKNAMMIVGAGAFQSLWETRGKQTIGLIPSNEPENSEFSHKDMQSVIPTELANRFAAPILVLPPLKESDYRQLLRRAITGMPQDLATRLARNGKNDIRNAIDNNLGARWVEGLLLKSLLQKNAAEHKIPELLSSAA